MTEEKKSMVPKLRFPEFTATWEQRKLEDCATIIMGQSPKSENYTNDPKDHILVQGNADLKNGQVAPRVWTTEVTKIGKVGDIILSVRAPVGEVGKTAYDVVLGRGVAAIRGNDFLLQTLLKLKECKYWGKVSAGSTFDSITSEILKSTLISMPAIEEQIKIGDFLSSVDKLITLHQRKLEGLSKLKKSLLQKMFPKNGSLGPELRFPGFTGDWEQHKLGDLGHTYGGLSGKSKQDFGHGDARFVTYMNVFSNPIGDPCMVDSIEIDDRQSRVRKGDVLFTTSSETPDEVGMSCVWPSDSENLYLNSFCFGYRPTTKINSNFLASLLRSPSVREKIIFLAQGISRYNISKNKVMEISIPLPSEEEQSQIGDFFTQLDKTITLHQRKLESLKKLKKSLLQQMFV